MRKCQEKTFLHSWNWGEFQKMEKNKIWRWGIYRNEELAGVALVVKIKAKRGTFLFIPHGPILNHSIEIENIGHLLLDKIKEIAEKEKAIFIRIAPISERKEESVFKKIGFRKAPIHIHPEITWQMDIQPAEEELLMGMRKTTRYLIRQAKKKGEVEIIQSQDIKDLEIFNKIYRKTASRHTFTPFSLNYLKNEFSAFSPDKQISLFLGRYKNEAVSGAVVVFWQDTAFYHHGASLEKYRKIPVSYLLQWEAIREAKKRNCRLYNFWGIAPESLRNKKHPWWGLTLFKMGFGGEKKEYAGTQDLPLSKRYNLTYFFEKLRKAKRGL